MTQEQKIEKVEQDSNQYLGKEKIWKLLFKFSIPCILSLLISSLYNIVDQIFIGNSELGYLGNAATGVVFPLIIIANAFAWCFGDGAAAFLSICQGKKDMDNAHRGMGNNILFTTLASVILIVLGYIFKEPLLMVFGATKDRMVDGVLVQGTLDLASRYFDVILVGLPFYMIANAFNSVIRADGSPKYSMLATAAGAVVNIILDPIFIFACDWGIEGAAWATVIGQIVSFALTVIYLFRTKTFKLKWSSFKPSKAFGGVVKLGVSTFITQMAIVAISLSCNLMLAKYGAMSKYGANIPIAVISIETKVFTVVINLIVGIVLGGQPIFGYNYGAKRYDRVRETFKLVFIASVIIGLVSTLIFELCPQVVIGIFGGSDDPLYMEFAKKTFRIFLSLTTFTCLIKLSSIFFQAVGQPVKATISSLIRDIVCFVPLVILLPYWLKDIDGVLYAAPISDFVAMCVAAGLLIYFFKKNLKDEPMQTEEKQANPVLVPSKPGVIVTIARQHGSGGKQIGKVLAEKMGVACYYKEIAAMAAEESGLAEEFISNVNQNSPTLMYDLYLTSTPVRHAVEAQDKIIRKIAENGSCVIVGRSADYVLRDNPSIVKVFVYAPMEYRIKRIMELYGDNAEEAERNVKHSDKVRAAYYGRISNKEWGKAEQYDICIDSSVGVEKAADMLYEYLQKRAEIK